MKKFLLLACCICSLLSFAQAQEQKKNSWNESGLSAVKCQWVHVRYTFDNGVEGWEKCEEGTSSQCVGKFCNNVTDATAKWKKEECNKYCITLQETLPIEGGNNVRSISGNSGVDLLGNYFGMWYKIGAVVLGLICVLVIVISGVQITFGGASEEAVTSAKARIWGALLSLILLFSSALILKTINPLFFT
jgi:hypothetical protein